MFHIQAKGGGWWDMFCAPMFLWNIFYEQSLIRIAIKVSIIKMINRFQLFHGKKHLSKWKSLLSPYLPWVKSHCDIIKKKKKIKVKIRCRSTRWYGFFIMIHCVVVWTIVVIYHCQEYPFESWIMNSMTPSHFITHA